MNGRVVNLEVEDSEGESVFGEKWAGWNVQKRFKMLSAYADSLIVVYMKDANMISSDMAKSRIAALKEIMNG